MAILKKIIIFTLPLLLTGCFEDFDPRIDTTLVLCLNSLITAGNPIEVKISRSWVYTDIKGESDHSVNDAKLSIYANGELVGNDYIPAEGDHIRIHASSKMYGEAEAEVIVPLPTQISALNYTPKVESVWMDQYPGRGLSARTSFDIYISLGIDDADDADNFHRLDFESFNPNSIYTDENVDLLYNSMTYTSFYYGSFEPLDPIFYEQTNAFDEILNYGYHNFFFSDRLLNRNTNAIDFGFTQCSFDISNWNGDTSYLECGWEITLYSISESYYKWLSYCWQADGVVLGDITNIGLAEPTWGYSNVSTGAGVVAAQSAVKVTLDLKDFLQNTFQSPPNN